jgi:hypothetical protein
MTITTDYCGALDAPTGDSELDSLLAEIRQRTGRSWQCEVRTMHPKELLWRTKKATKFYSLLLYVGGVMPYQLIMCGSGDISVTKGYLIGYLSGLDDAAKRQEGE